MTSFCIDSANQNWMFLTASSATTKNMILWDLRFGGLEVTSWSHPSERIIPMRSWPLTHGSRCQHVFTNCSREGEISLWDLASQSQTHVFWPSTEQPLTYKHEWSSTALTSSAVDTDVVFTGDSEGSIRCWNMKTAERCGYLCGPYRKNLISSPMTANDLQLKCNPSKISYRQMNLKNTVTRIYVEDKAEMTVTSGSGSDHRPTLPVNESHQDTITDLLSVWPDCLVSSCRDGTIKLWKIC